VSRSGGLKIVLLGLFALMISCRKEEPAWPVVQGATNENRRLLVSVSKTNLTTTSRVTVELQLYHPADEDWSHEAPNFEGWTVREHVQLDSELYFGRTVRRRERYLLEPFLAGTYTVPAMAFRYLYPARRKLMLETAPFTLEVRSMLADETADSELLPLLDDVEEPIHPVLLWGSVLGAVICVGLAVRHGLRRRRLNQKAESETPVAEALKRLERPSLSVDGMAETLERYVERTGEADGFEALHGELDYFQFSREEPEYEDVERLRDQLSEGIKNHAEQVAALASAEHSSTRGEETVR
jgi:hypothetical protein